MAQRILLVDDDVGEIASARRALAGAGYDVALATNATDALAEVEAARPDAVVLAPECDGGEAAAVAQGSGAPVVAIGEEAPGFGRRVARPIGGEELVRVVREALGAASNANANATRNRPPPLPSPSRRRAEEGSARGARPQTPSWFDAPDDPPASDDTFIPAAAIPDGAAELRALLQAEADRAARALAERADAPEHEVEAKPSPAPVDLPPAEPEPPPAPLRPIDVADVEAKHAQVQRADYFAILDVSRDAPVRTIREAAERLLAELARERLPSTLPDGVEAKLSEIRDVVRDAREVLTNEALRREYLAGLAR